MIHEAPPTDLLVQAAEIVITTQFGSPTALQRNLGISYVRATNVLAALELAGIVARQEGIETRDVLVRAEELDTVLAALRSGAQS